MKKIILFLINKIGFFTKNQIFDEIDAFCDIIVDSDETLTYEEAKTKKDLYIDMYLDFKQDLCE